MNSLTRRVPRVMSLLGGGDIAFALLMASIVGLLVVPLPTPVLDLLLTTNIAVSVVLLLTAIYVPHPLRLSSFPSILLVATLFRLALNVSSTRLILGQADAGRVIEAFGEFVVRGNYVVGGVIFLILTVIQFVVIAKGSERVAEVAARFTLDAMPGKQMAIDADLRAGAFTLAEARKRRAELQRESQLFGAMDGAMKFVKGDAIAGIIITVINLIGGLIIGVIQRDMGAGEAAQLYSLLTIGDGLVAQIPALLVAISAGLIVTRVGSIEDGPTNLGSEIIAQLGQNARVFGVAAVLLGAMGIVPGLPTVPFLVLAAVAAGIAALIVRREAARDAIAEASETSPKPTAGADRHAPPVPAVTPVTLELSPALTDALRAAGIDEETLRNEVQTVRDALFSRLGVRLPAVRIRPSAPGLAEWGVRVLVFEVPELVAELDPRLDVVYADPRAAGFAQGSAPRHPVAGIEGVYTDPTRRDELRSAGLEVHEPVRRLLSYVAAATQRAADRFVGLAEVQAGLDALEPTHGALIDAVVPRPVSLARLTGVLKRLVGEGVGVRDLRAILEALAEDAREEHDIIELTEIARRGLARSIMAQHAPNRTLRAWLVSPAIEQTVRESIRRDDGKPSLALPPRVTDEVLRAAVTALAGYAQPMVVTSSDVRRYVRQLLVLQFPSVVVLGMGEVHEGIRLDVAGTIQVGGGPR